jgi:hypothetical protein
MSKESIIVIILLLIEGQILICLFTLLFILSHMQKDILVRVAKYRKREGGMVYPPNYDKIKNPA